VSITHHVHGYWRRHFASFFRVLHIYISMFSFAILFFFASTGLILNNSEGKAQRTTSFKGKVALAWVKTQDSNAVAKLQVVERLRSAHLIRGALHEFTIDDSQCAVSFRAPGYAADATINRDTGDYELTETRDGFVAVMTDLHKGQDAGTAWHWLINASATLIILVSATGMALMCYLKRRRFNGLVVAGIGVLLCYLIYFIFVP
jgi:hypothetical protein